MAPLKVHGPVRMRSIQTGITKWKEGSFEIVEKDNKVSLVVHYSVGGIPKTFQLSHNIKTVVLRPNGGKLCCLMLTLKDASFLTIDKVPSKDANEMRMYLDAVLHDRVHTAVKPSQGSGSFGGVLGSRTTQKEANRQFPYIENQEDADQEESRNKHQKTITSPLKYETPAERERVEICTAWVKTLAGANIPLSKTDHPLVGEFLDIRVQNGGAIPGRTQLTETYVPEVYLKEKENLKLKLKDKKITVIFVECCHDEARSILNVLFAPLQPDCCGHINSLLVVTVFLDAVNHTTVSQAVVKAVSEFQIDYENVVVIDTDDANYMKMSFDSVFSTLFPNSVHRTCLAHIVNLIGESFRKPFQLVDTF
uniref:ubiquitinyl hydrolase 1 n=1 Tax=Gopherus evgoodei TaxID=1825980 RepID=A0A8C4YJK5_9SAUR